MIHRRNSLIACIAACVVSHAMARDADDAKLQADLRTFLTGATPTERQSARARILAIKNLSHATLEESLQSLELWRDGAKLDLAPEIELGQANQIKLVVELTLPAAYSPAKAWPLIIALHGQGGTAAGFAGELKHLLGDRARGHIIAAPREIDGPSFSGPADVERRPRDLLLALRKMLRIDNDRVFIAGYSLGGHRAWMSALQHSDCFAGALAMAGCAAQLPGGDALFDEFLPNLRNMRLLCAWGELDLYMQDGKPVANSGIEGVNSGMLRTRDKLNQSQTRMVRLSGIGHIGAYPPGGDIDWLLQARRQKYPKQVSQAFRLSEVSTAYWLRTDALQGPPLPDAKQGQYKVPMDPGEDPAVAIVRYLKANIGRVQASVDGQTIELTTRKSKRIELLLHDDLIDLSKPVKILRNKSKNHDGMIQRDLGVALDEAAATWDFVRMPQAKVIVPVGGSAKVVTEGKSGAPRKAPPRAK